MGKIIGIDLGTTNSVVAVMEGGEPVVIPTAEGGRLCPSVVAFTKNGEEIVGQTARRQAVVNPDNTIFSVKRLMGRRYDDSEVVKARQILPYKIVEGPGHDARVYIPQTGKEYTPQEISARILRKLKKDAEAYLGEPVTQAVITVPAYFNDSQRQATKDAGQIAGLEVLRIINEPTAASLAYGLDKKEAETILVFDLGGGTFDVSILEVGEGVVEVRSTSGDTFLGGDDWDQRIMDWMVEEFKKQHGIDLRTDRVAMQRIKEEAENAKIRLSTETTTKLKLPFIAADAGGPKHLELELSRAKFQEMTADLVEKTTEPAMRALEDSGLSIGQIQKVLLVGGATRMPAIQDKVRKLFGKEPYKDIDPDKVVGMGAAIQAAVLAGEVKDIVLLDVTSLSLGIETVGGVFTKLIERNTQIPSAKSRIFTTAADGQTVVEVHVLQGERELAAHNKSLGRFELRNIPPAPRGVPQIEVTFEIDANGIVNVSAKDLATGNKQRITIESPTNLTQDEIDRMVKEAAIYAEEDAKKREEAQARNKAHVEIDSAERTLRELADFIDMDRQRRLKAKIESLRAALQAYDLEKIQSETKELQDLMYSISTEAYIQVGGDRVQAPGERGKVQLEEEMAPSEEDLFDWFKKS